MIDRRTIDVPRLVADLIAIAAEIKAVKAVLRAPWERPMRSEQLELCALKRRATALCVLRAHVRGRQHLTSPPRDGWSPDRVWDAETYNRELATRVASEYLRMDPRPSHDRV